MKKGKLFKDSKFEYFAVGQPIFIEGQPGGSMYVVVEGEVDIIVKNKLVERVTVGGLLGEMGIVDDSPRSASAVARTDCKLIPVDKKSFMFMVQETPSFAIQVMQTMSRRLRQANVQM